MAFDSPRLKILHSTIVEKSIIWDKERRILAPDGRRNNWLIDLRKTLLDPLALTIVAEEFWARFADAWPFQVGGLEIAAVPLITAIQLQGLKRGLTVNGFVIRRERKNYGLSRTWEGEIGDEPIIIVDDTFNSASSAEKVRVALCEVSRSMHGIFAIINYLNPSGKNWLARNNVPIVSLFTLPQFGIKLERAPVPNKRSEFAEVWHFTHSGHHYFHIEPGSAPALDHERLYFGSDGGYFWALDLKSGAPAWHFQVGGSALKRIRSSPALHLRQVYFGSYEGNVYCLDTETGEKRWSFAGADRIESSPALAPELGMVFIGLEHALPSRRGSIAALQMETGEKLWEFAVTAQVHCSPAYSSKDRLMACGTNDGELLLIDPMSRKVIWRFAASGAIKAAPVFDPDGQVMFVTLDGWIYSVSLSTGKARWSRKVEDAVHSTPLIFNGKVYVGTTGKAFYVLDVERGDVIHRMLTRGRVHASPRLIGERLYFGSTAGVVYELDPNKYEVTGWVQLPERITDPIAYSPLTGFFYARSYDGQIFAFRRTV